MSWFLKGNSRRFFRVDMPIKFYATPKEKSYTEEVFFNGVSYINDSYFIENDRLKSAVLSEIEKIQEHRDIILKITNEIIEKITQIMGYLESHTNGIKVTNDPGYWINKKIIESGFSQLNLLKGSSPKTYSILSTLEDKFLSRLTSITSSIEKSNLKEIYSSHIPQGFKIEGTIENMSANQKLKRVPVARYFIALYRYFDFNMHIFEVFNDDHQLANHPRFWKERDVNISACGIGVSDIRKYSKYQILDIKIYYPEEDEIFRFEGKVLESRINPKTGKNFTTIDFIFPTEKEQLGLLSFIQLRECQQSRRAILNARN